MSDKLGLYETFRTVPANAQKEIRGGRLSGKTDINPMWRIKALTEQFGPVGFGWKYEIVEKRLEQGGNNEIAAFVDINLYIKMGGEWSEAIPGTGGSMFVAKEKSGPYTSDECFKMALTDAISVSCKALGVGADVYWEKDKTKYNGHVTEDDVPEYPTTTTPPPAPTITKPQAKRMFALSGGDAEIVRAVLTDYGYERSEQVKKSEYEEVCNKIESRAKAKAS